LSRIKFIKIMTPEGRVGATIGRQFLHIITWGKSLKFSFKLFS
jgi:hypothetical protein